MPRNNGQSASSVSSSRRASSRAIALLALICCAVTACGGGGGGTGGASPTDQPAQPGPTISYGSVTVYATSSSGKPFSRASVSLNGGFAGRTAETDDNGVVHFGSVPVGEATVQTFLAGTLQAGRRFVVSGTGDTVVRLTLEPVASATPVLLGSKAVPSADGRYLTLDLDIAVLDAASEVREQLAVEDVRFDADSFDRPFEAGFEARVLSVAPVLATAGPAPAMATAVLLNEGEGTARFDPASQRLDAIADFLRAVSAPDVATVATYRGLALNPDLRWLGDFTSDGASLIPSVVALAGRESGASPLLSALAPAVEYVKDYRPGIAGLRKSIVAVSSAYSGWPVSDAVDEALGAGIRVNGIGIDDEPLCWSALISGGFYAYIYNPAQIPIVFKRIRALETRSLPHHRVRMDLLGNVAGEFGHGGSVSGWLSIRVGPDTQMYFWIVIPI